MRIQLLTLEACERFGIAYQTAAQAVRVCKDFESWRQRQLSFAHHKEVSIHFQAEAVASRLRSGATDGILRSAG